MENLSNELISWPEIDDVATPLSSFCLIDPDTELLKLNKLNSFEKTLNLNSSTEAEKESQSPMHNKESENLPSKKVRFISNQESKQHPVFISKKTKNKEGNIEATISNYSNGRWKKEERAMFAYALFKFGTNWKKINNIISTRNYNQINSHAQKFLKRLKKCNYLIEEKNLNFEELNWNNSYKLLKENLTDEELLFVFLSIDSEIEDNKRWSQKKENYELILRKNTNLEKINNNSQNNIEENNRYNIQYPNNNNSNNNSINLDEYYNNDYFLNYENILKENKLFDNYLENFKLSFEDINNSFNFEI
jgi:SHAQKYF class myb-like DNA-binding protein